MLVLTPATVSFPAAERELVVLGAGLAVMLAVNYLLLRHAIEPLRRLTLAQDTGGAIRGPVRADFFWGFGDEAGQHAGRMRQQGQLWVLWPNGSAPGAAS